MSSCEAAGVPDLTPRHQSVKPQCGSIPFRSTMSGFAKLPPGTQLSVGSHTVTVVRYLSKGGFAHIYEVQIATSDKKGRIGCLKRVIVPDKGGLNQLRKEVDVMKTLKSSRCIVQYYDSHAERLDNGTYQVLVLMELCPNKSLLDYMNVKIATKLTEMEILTIMKDISIGVYEMHRKHLIHRDIKIENVLIDAKHNFKLCDFGSTSAPIAPSTNEQQMQALAHDIMYQTTPQYRSPEMIDLYRGFPIDHKADIWALGCFLYKLCYYTTPFEAQGDIAILHASFQFPPAPPYSGDLKNLIIIMLQENPVMRPTVVQVLMLLAKMLHQEFADWKIEDIYATGPYNFQALGEYQRQRQEELRKQQMYYQQQTWQQESQAQTRGRFIDGQLAANGENPKQNPPNLTVRSRSLEQQQQQQPPPSSPPQPPSQELEPQEPQHSLSSSEGFSELADLDNINERYPSVENLLADINQPPVERASRDGTDKTGELYKSYASRALSKHSVDESSRSQAPGKSPQEPHADLYKQTKKTLQNLDNIEAWESHRSYIDKNAEQLADDIFSRPLSAAPVQEPAKSTELQRTVSEGASVYKLPLEHADEDSKKPELGEGFLPSIEAAQMAKRDLMNTNQNGLTASKDVVKQPRQEIINSPRQVEALNPTRQPHINLITHTSPEMMPLGYFSSPQALPQMAKLGHHAQRSSSNLAGSYEPEAPPLPTRKSANPWGEYTVAKTEKSGVDTQFEGLKISKGEARDAKHVRQGSSTDPNLIDLEVGLESSDSSLSGPEVMEGKDINYGQAPSLLDLDIEETAIHDKPLFKKRLSSAPAASMSLQEEVIDFASDDENPDNQSNMSRMAIRNSLSKKRAKEHRKS